MDPLKVSTEEKKALNAMKPSFIFLLGRPACGKSTVSRLLADKIKKLVIAKRAELMDDFSILKEMLEKDVEFKRHKKEGNDIVITDRSMLDEAILVLKDAVAKNHGESRLTIIEFARDNYLAALKVFDKTVLESAIILYIKASFETCLKRNGKPKRSNAVPVWIMERYYRTDDIQKILEDGGIGTAQKSLPCRLFVIENEEEGIEKLSRRLDKFMTSSMGNFIQVGDS